MSDWVRCDSCERMATRFQAGMAWYRLVSGDLPLVQYPDRHFCTWSCLRKYAEREAPDMTSEAAPRAGAAGGER
jgi:hypothetical protein